MKATRLLLGALMTLMVSTSAFAGGGDNCTAKDGVGMTEDVVGAMKRADWYLDSNGQPTQEHDDAATAQ